jgi:putative tricarboxylic transport membrane protein
MDPFFAGLIAVFQWPALGYLVLGVLLGIWLGAVPGLGGIIGLVLLLPFTFGMDPVSAFALLLGMYAVTTTSDTIASVLLGIPGTAASQATILDGFPLAQQGQAARAFGAAFTVSAFGGVFGAIILAVSLPIALPLILAFRSPEIFMLGILGLTMVGSLSGGSVLKGLIAALLGLMMAMVGYGETVPVPRYWFGSDYLLDGLPIVPVVLGLFAIPELLELAVRNTSISRTQRADVVGGGLMDGVRDAYRNWWLVIRCCFIGTYVGMLPGLGAAIVDWLAYGHAVQSAKDKSMFGKGDIRGVIAPETANNATKGGALIPTVAFGIPGSLGTAILLGALLIQGLTPGPTMLTTELSLTYSMVWTIVIANVLAAGLLMIWSRQVAKLAFLPGHLIVPGVILFVFMGAWISGASIGDWVTCFVMGVIGTIMKRSGWPRPPLVLALILGAILENAFQLSMRAHSGVGWLQGPVVLIILAITILTLALAVRGMIKTRKNDDAPEVGEGSERNPMISLPFSAILLALFVWAAIEALAWPPTVRQLPLTIAVPAIALAFWVLIRDLFEAKAEIRAFGGLRPALLKAADIGELPATGAFLGYVLVMLLLTPFVGQIVALAAFMAVYLWRWGGYGWKVSLAYTAGGVAFLYGFYGKIIHVLWYPSMLFG